MHYQICILNQIFLIYLPTGEAGAVPRLSEMAGVDSGLFTSTDEPELEFDEGGLELSSAKEGNCSFLFYFSR